MNEELNYYKLDDFYRKCMDGTIDIDSALDLKSEFGKRVIKHEEKHLMMENLF